MTALNGVPVLIDGVEFESVTKAAEYLEVFPAVLSKALKTDGNLKGFKVAYKNPEAISRKHCISVYLINPATGIEHKFDSCTAAAKFLNVDATAVTGALKAGRTHVKGFKLVRASDTNIKKECSPTKKLIHTKAGVKVVASNGTSFKSIKQSAAYLNMPSWELVHALRDEGKFVKNGITYTAMTPAKSRNMKPKETVVEEVQQPVQEVKQEQVSGIALAKKLLKDKVTEFISRDEFKMAKELLDAIEQIKE